MFLATDVKHRRKVAIKVLRPELAASMAAERFLRGIAIATQLQHPHIVPLLDSGSADGSPYFDLLRLATCPPVPDRSGGYRLQGRPSLKANNA